MTSYQIKRISREPIALRSSDCPALAYSRPDNKYLCYLSHIVCPWGNRPTGCYRYLEFKRADLTEEERVRKVQEGLK